MTITEQIIHIGPGEPGETLPTVAETLAAVRAGHIDPQEAHPITSGWTPVVHWSAAATGAVSLAVCWAYWAGHDTAGARATIGALVLAAVTLLARAQEWNTR